jgi:hypothetical protein
VALTLEAEQQMRAVGLIEFYEQDADAWLDTVRDATDFVRRNFPDGAVIRPDDVAKAMVTILEVHEAFQTFRKTEKLRPKYWNRHFADLLIDRTWQQINRGNQ